MMNYIETVGNIKVYTEALGKELEVIFLNGSDIVSREIYRTSNAKRAIENLFEKLDTYTEEFLYLYTNDIEKVTGNTYRPELMTGSAELTTQDSLSIFANLLMNLSETRTDYES